MSHQWTKTRSIQGLPAKIDLPLFLLSADDTIVEWKGKSVQRNKNTLDLKTSTVILITKYIFPSFENIRKVIRHKNLK